MATERGLQAVPRGLSRDLTAYLQSLDAYVRRLSGTVRGSDETRALRAYEASRLPVGTGSSGSGADMDVNAVASVILRDSAITERKLADGAVTRRKLAAGAVEESVLADGAVSTAKLASGAVRWEQLGTGAVTAEKLGTCSVTASKLAFRAVGSEALADGAVTERVLGRGAVGEDALAFGCVTEDALADAAVTGRKLAPGAITADHLALSVLPRIVSGTAADAELVLLPGTWAEKPVVVVASFKIEKEETGGGTFLEKGYLPRTPSSQDFSMAGDISSSNGDPGATEEGDALPPLAGFGLRVGIADLREEPEKSGTWMFTACVRVRDEQGERSGTLEWIAFGRGGE